jgi:outer membrane protein assembly factor BamB
MDCRRGIGIALLLAPVPEAQHSAGQDTGTALEPALFDHPLEVVPVQAGDRILLTSTLRLFALDAGTGELAWSSPQPAGWEALAPVAQHALFKGLDPDGLLVLPAAGERVAVAALQVPLSRAPNEDWQGIVFRVALPERRLFAFEFATGRPLWDHAPPADWDGVAGSFEERMQVIASPLVVGTRVLVPCTFDVSSIDYHVACYALDTGARLWTTFVTRGQVERGYQGYLIREFAAAPLIASPDGKRVFAQTDLGQLAALDIDSGALQWQSEYEPIPLPKTKSYSPQARKRYWRTTPPLVVGDVLLATPRDCAKVLVLDLATGRELGSLPVKRPWKQDEGRVDCLVGARGETLYLGGEQLVALTRAGGFGSEAEWQVAWTYSLGARSGGLRGARARLVGDELFAQGRDGTIHVLAASDGSLRRTLEADAAASLLVTDEALFVVGRDHVQRIER